MLYLRLNDHTAISFYNGSDDGMNTRLVDNITVIYSNFPNSKSPNVEIATVGLRHNKENGKVIYI